MSRREAHGTSARATSHVAGINASSNASLIKRSPWPWRTGSSSPPAAPRSAWACRSLCTREGAGQRSWAPIRDLVARITRRIAPRVDPAPAEIRKPTGQRASDSEDRDAGGDDHAPVGRTPGHAARLILKGDALPAPMPPRFERSAVAGPHLAQVHSMSPVQAGASAAGPSVTTLRRTEPVRQRASAASYAIGSCA
jgi:hypothetical protein